METVRNLKHFGHAVRKLRAEKGMTQKELADRSNVNRVRISNIECGSENVTLKTALDLLGSLGEEIIIKDRSVKITSIKTETDTDVNQGISIGGIDIEP